MARASNLNSPRRDHSIYVVYTRFHACVKMPSVFFSPFFFAFHFIYSFLLKMKRKKNEEEKERIKGDESPDPNAKGNEE